MKKAKPKSKVKKVVATKPPKMQGKLVGKVSHYFSDISVGVIKLSAPLKEGDQIRIVGGEATDFNQVVKSMQKDHESVKTARKGMSIGLKVKEKVREGYRVYKI